MCLFYGLPIKSYFQYSLRNLLIHPWLYRIAEGWDCHVGVIIIISSFFLLYRRPWLNFIFIVSQKLNMQRAPIANASFIWKRLRGDIFGETALNILSIHLQLLGSRNMKNVLVYFYCFWWNIYKHIRKENLELFKCISLVGRILGAISTYKLMRLISFSSNHSRFGLCIFNIVAAVAPWISSSVYGAEDRGFETHQP